MEFEFMQFKKGYRYNTDTLLLLDFILKQKLKGKLLEVGCGCGIIGIVLKAYFKKLELTLLDILEQNCELTRKNLIQNKCEAELLCADFAEFNQKNSFDIIVSNPPFYRKQAFKTLNEHKNKARFEDSLNLELFIKQAFMILKPRAKLYFCYEAGALMRLCFFLQQSGFHLSKLICVHKDKESKARLLLIEASKGYKAQCELCKPFFVYEKAKLSSAMKQVLACIKVKSNDI